MRSTKWSRIPWIGKSVTRVRANSANTSEIWSFGTASPQSIGSAGPGGRWIEPYSRKVDPNSDPRVVAASKSLLLT